MPQPPTVGHSALTAVVCLSVRLSVCLSVCLVSDPKPRTEVHSKKAQIRQEGNSRHG